MKTEYEGKKLLILGGNAETIPLVEIAQEMGVRVIVTSSVPEDPAKKVAWKSEDVDGMDVPGLVALAKREGVDGVLVGVADVLVPAYCKVCNALNLPCYATEEIVGVFSFKDEFKSTCERYGVHGIPEYYLDEKLRDEDIAKIEFPVMVKPVDSSSGQGITKCDNPDELKKAVPYALSFSKKKRFIVEKYMDCDDVGIYYTFKDGYCSASCIYDRNSTYKQPGLSRVNLGSIYPSKHIDDYFSRMHNNAVRMFKAIGIKNGVLLISAFYENGEFYVYDPGFRLQGEAPHLLMKAVHGFDQREMLIRFALTGSEGDVDLRTQDDIRFRGKVGATIWILLKKGKIGRIAGLDKLKDDSRVATIIQRLYVGDEVKPDWIGTEKQVLARLYVVCESRGELKKAVHEFSHDIKITDQNGEDLVLEWINPGSIDASEDIGVRRTAVITGGSKGIGLETAKLLHRQGYNVAIIARDEEKVHSAVDSIGSRCKGYVCDVSDVTQIGGVLNAINKDFGSIDVLINNAGVLDASKIDTLSEEEWDRVLDTNLKGTYFMIQKSVPYLEKGKSPRIINISSNAGRMGGFENGLAYTASKGGVIALTYGAARRLASKGITVNCVAPGTITTEMAEKGYDEETKKKLIARFPIGRMGRAEEVASAISYYASEDSSFTTGSVLDVNGGMFMG